MADPMRIRAKQEGDKTVVRVLMAHEMETGQRKDSAGKVIPAHFIQKSPPPTTARPYSPRSGAGDLQEPVPAVPVQRRQGR